MDNHQNSSVSKPPDGETDSRSIFVIEMTRHDQGLRRYLFTLLLNEQAVDEVMQETALALWQKVDEYDSNLPFFPWACRFAYFKVLEYRKSNRRNESLLQQDVLERVSFDAIESGRSTCDQREALKACLGKLSDLDQELLSRRYKDGQKVNQLARSMQTPVKRLYNRLDRLRQKLADCIRLKMDSQNA